MIYAEWNEHIAKYFFKPENAGKDVLFYLTKQDLIKYSLQHFSRASDDEIWANFIHAIKYGQLSNAQKKSRNDKTSLLNPAFAYCHRWQQYLEFVVFDSVLV